MDGTIALILVLFSAILFVVVIAGWWYASRVKRRLEQPAARLDRRQAGTMKVSDGAATRLHDLSPEPIFLKQTTDGVRVQLDNRPFVPLRMLTEAAVAASLHEAAGVITQRFGPEWSVLVTCSRDGTLSVRRLI